MRLSAVVNIRDGSQINKIVRTFHEGVYGGKVNSLYILCIFIIYLGAIITF